jgi:tetratricopeptide (TPR) repeat protein/transcriptional regulator with XRE-family HTH domain
VAEPGLSFAGLLRQLRAEAKLTQEELAEAASLSPRSVSDLERGITRTAHKDTALLLANALGLTDPARALFVLAARGRAPSAEVLAARPGAGPGAFAAAATRSLPRDIAAFTGRQAELAELMGALASGAASGGVVGICAIDGMAGIGKTTLAVHAGHRLATAFLDGQFFLPLHAHTPGQRPVDPADALASLLLTTGVPASQIPPGAEARAGRWRDFAAGKKILLVLDDAAGHDQVTPLLPGTAGSLVLITSRRRLTALDAAVISLDTLRPPEAAELLARLAARAEIRATDPAVVQITRLCGYLPLAIGILGRKLSHHPAWTVGHLAAELTAARDRLALMYAENLSVAAAFGLSYQDLAPGPRRLFHRLGLVAGPSIDAYGAAALDDTGLDTARRHLEELFDQHLLTEPEPGRYQLHDLLREHARALAAADNPADSDAATGRLLDYYLHTAVTAGQVIVTWTALGRPSPGRPPAHVPDLSTRHLANGWLESERPNLHAAAEQAAGRAMPQYSVALAAAISGFLLAHGHWDQSAALHRAALAAACQAGDRPGEAAALAQLGNVHSLTGDYLAAAEYLARARTLYRDLGDRAGEGYASTQLSYVQSLTGDYPAAAASHRRALALARSLNDRSAQAEALGNLGWVQQLTGDYPAAAASLQQALALHCDTGNPFGQAEALNVLGVVQQETGDYPAAADSQQQALALYRDLGDQIGQAWALNDLGIVHQQTGDYPAAAASHQQALQLFRDLGNRLGQAEALNRLGQLSLRTLATHQARAYHTQALAIARGIGVPLEEARALEGIGQSHLHDADPGQGTTHMQQALAIYQRIGVPGARRVQETLQYYQLTPMDRHPPAAGRHVQESLDHQGPTFLPAEPQPAAPSSEGNPPRRRGKPAKDKSSAGRAAE